VEPKLKNIRVLVVGGASLDTLAGADNLVAGGAGMYTAMAAHRSGASVTLCSPRPEPMPEPLRPVAESLEWIGPVIDVAALAHFKITYRDGLTTYETSKFGAEEHLTPTDLPSDLSIYDYVHLIPLGNINQQYEMALACRQRGAQRISIGTALNLINRQPNAARKALQVSDLFFMNAEEATSLFGSVDSVRSRTDQLMFVTLGGDGAIVIQGETATRIGVTAANVVDPTGAGDTFCGSTLVGLAQGKHPVMAVRQSMPLAAKVTENVGATALMTTSLFPSETREQRVSVNTKMVDEIAKLVARDKGITPFDFVGVDLPSVGHPATLDYFFASTLQQFGFWTTSGEKYDRPLIATLDGEERKGAFYFFRAYLRWLENEPEMLSPARQASLSKADLLTVLRADDGTDPMPVLDLHLSMARQYGRDMLALGITPQSVVEEVNAATSPVSSLFGILDRVGAYKEDPLRKKSALLAIILQQRPETFLKTNDYMPPIVDYHIMRSSLRTGLINVDDETLAAKLTGRQILTKDEEWAVRRTAYSAIESVAAQSGKSMGAVDWFFFQARKRCPEMTAPHCSECAVDPACAHRKELFQPVRRTSFY
jgi:sugar/nucleoside kinase (ribokinase family)